ncbi:hypothetical protein BO85DRAFT_294519 [Aspergillus piperis CBS 112811]|uniref:Transmembrane protein n=1 Tax=Aspergillus piperis CBS 112811 TaxID=1448313 RepID=A0A8G1VMZ8_9EURO|nr:hypothetical protein BO85DRAFT_294519 [Aspergillus piperis CBS 112811]RAH58057.1 hypothetical protein BO85DRAFT_294519 [Aspergillus piperis CBS 112811]
MVAVVETRVMSIVRLREAKQRLICDVKEAMMLLMMVFSVIGVLLLLFLRSGSGGLVVVFDSC